ncbi:MAG: GTPase HflX [Oscillospiraceae bacterium]|jgi:GTP-binding protein HflX|uniref:GTPase HflX n=1 Tax=Caproicibacterium lactatifermentans TaxID=2666138 RepID=UPI003D8BD1A2|nr:GTPase HflX [Oscillospiraceae bacterium]
MYENKRELPRALLVECDTGEDDAESSLAELYELVRSAGAVPFGAMTQKRPSADAATCVGKGMVQQIADFCEKHHIELLIFDRELTPTQIRNLEEDTSVRVVDRTMLIMDIFACSARSREGKLQVELAQLEYLLPRLSGRGTALSRLGGGIGTRGPGETKLETDRRHIRGRIRSLQVQLEEVEKHRQQIERRRRKDGVVTAALVGYTNAGKSTLMNVLTDAGVLAEDRLFATLDPTARALRLPNGFSVMLIDTVGLVRRLPHQLVKAFRSTLEQAAQADILLNVCDASSPEAQTHLKVTSDLLTGLGCTGKMLPVLNKCDQVPGLTGLPQIGQGIRISAKTGEGIPNLLQAIQDALPVQVRRVQLLLPFSQSGLAARVREQGTVLQEKYTSEGLALEAFVGPALFPAVQPFLQTNSITKA